MAIKLEKYTRFEKARIIGSRALQISMGAPILLDEEVTAEEDSLSIAFREFEMDVIPITVKREYENE
ncbi:MAG: DNA-directed RNA polymerase subunit K [Methanosarcinaceae archaeon]|nr:DNA-directed RNA polymerase subunit K [Methanosarcinaceae archaeon]